MTDRDRKKLADKDRKLQEKAVQIKAAALADDDDVFDVAFEQQGEAGTTASATDIQVCKTFLLHKAGLPCAVHVAKLWAYMMGI